MTGSTMESVESFRLRARAWLAEHMPPRDQAPPPLVEDDAHEWERARELQRMLYAGGFAGICFPREYGGLGLTIAHQQAFTEESDPYEMPLMLNVPTFAICAATLLDMGDEEQKRDRIGAAIRGEEITASSCPNRAGARISRASSPGRTATATAGC